MRRPLIALVLAGALVPAAAPAQQADDITFAYPNIALTFSAGYLAEDRGFYAKNGLKVKGLVIAGPGATNAVISGSADFALASAVVQTRAASKGQRLLSIANPLERPVVQIILRKDLVPNFDPKAPLNDRIRALQGRTIAVDAIGSILHGFPLLLAKRAGLDTATDFRISPMAPPAALAAFKAKQIDGFAMSMPWPIGPVLDGEAVVIASGADGDPPDMVPFGMASIITQPATCEKRKSVCEKMGRAITEAANLPARQSGRGDGAAQEAVRHARRQGVRGRLRADPQGDAGAPGDGARRAGERRALQRRGRAAAAGGPAQEL